MEEPRSDQCPEVVHRHHIVAEMHQCIYIAGHEGAHCAPPYRPSAERAKLDGRQYQRSAPVEAGETGPKITLEQLERDVAEIRRALEASVLAASVRAVADEARMTLIEMNAARERAKLGYSLRANLTLAYSLRACCKELVQFTDDVMAFQNTEVKQA